MGVSVKSGELHSAEVEHYLVAVPVRLLGTTPGAARVFRCVKCVIAAGCVSQQRYFLLCFIVIALTHDVCIRSIFANMHQASFLGPEQTVVPVLPVHLRGWNPIQLLLSLELRLVVRQVH